jgi:hypothetical protein
MTLEEQVLEFRRKYPNYPEWLVQVNIDRMKQDRVRRDRAKRIAEQGMTSRFVSLNGESRRDDEVGR